MFVSIINYTCKHATSPWLQEQQTVLNSDHIQPLIRLDTIQMQISISTYILENFSILNNFSMLLQIKCLIGMVIYSSLFT